METLRQNLKNATLASTINCLNNEAIAKGVENLHQNQLISWKKGAPSIPPKPQKNLNKLPQVHSHIQFKRF